MDGAITLGCSPARDWKECRVTTARTWRIGDLQVVDLLELKRNEISGLLSIKNNRALQAKGWDLAFWSVVDEARVEDSVVLIGHSSRATSIRAGWSVVECRFYPARVDTTDCEAITRNEGSLWVVGSHFGSKSRGVDIRRSFVARFSEPELEDRQPKSMLHVARSDFRLHRLVNDALATSCDLPSPSDHLGRRFAKAREHLLKTARERAKGRSWENQLAKGDWPINVEGATFATHGALILGLRFPVTADGQPILVALSGIERLFDQDKGEPEVLGAWPVEGPGHSNVPMGIRDLEGFGSEIHLIAGRLDREFFQYKHPAPPSHWRLSFPKAGTRGPATLVRQFPEEINHVEGLTTSPEGRWMYVCDEDRVIRLVFA